MLFLLRNYITNHLVFFLVCKSCSCWSCMYYILYRWVWVPQFRNIVQRAPAAQHEKLYTYICKVLVFSTVVHSKQFWWKMNENLFCWMLQVKFVYLPGNGTLLHALFSAGWPAAAMITPEEWFYKTQFAGCAKKPIHTVYIQWVSEILWWAHHNINSYLYIFVHRTYNTHIIYITIHRTLLSRMVCFGVCI